MRATFYTLDVFTDRRFTGNPLAVIPDASGIPEERLLDVAREFNLSETVFVYPAADPAHAARLRIFTPARELPFAGHPTIGTAILLATLRGNATGEQILVLEEGVGPVPVRVGTTADGASFAQLSVARMPERLAMAVSRRDLARVLSVSEDEIVDRAPGPAVFTCGVPFLFVEVSDRSALGRVKLDPASWDAARSGSRDVEGIFIFTSDATGPGAAFRARMLAPGLSVPEDPATGSAVAAMAGHLFERDAPGDGTHRWRIEQGFEMGRPSILDLEYDVRRGGITAVRVGGSAVIMSQGELVLS